MAANRPPSGDGLASQLDGMSTSQLYEILSQVKMMIDQNEQGVRRMLIENPPLTRFLFEAQIMLGMVQPRQVMPNIQQALSQPQSAQVVQQPNVQTTQSLPGQSGLQGQASSPQPSVSSKLQHPTQPSMALPSTLVPPMNFQSQTMPSNPPLLAQQTKSFLDAQSPSSLPQSSQIHNLTVPPPAPPHYSILPSHMPVVSGQTQQPLQTSGVFNQPLQPPLPQQPSPLSIQPFCHQLHSQMPHALGFRPSSAPKQLLSQPMFHGGPCIGPDYSNQAGTSIQAERGVAWAPGLPEKAATGAQLSGPPPLVSGQTASGTGGQPPRPPLLTPEMEKALLQQVMSLTPEQINLLPPEQRHQVLQLQEMLK